MSQNGGEHKVFGDMLSEMRKSALLKSIVWVIYNHRKHRRAARITHTMDFSTQSYEKSYLTLTS